LVFLFNKENRNSDNLNDIFDKYLFSFANYKFDRDEANNYVLCGWKNVLFNRLFYQQ